MVADGWMTPTFFLVVSVDVKKVRELDSLWTAMRGTPFLGGVPFTAS